LAPFTHKLVEVRGGEVRVEKRRFQKEKNSTIAQLGVQPLGLYLHSRHYCLIYSPWGPLSWEDVTRRGRGDGYTA
jgi:hypothetical protein